MSNKENMNALVDGILNEDFDFSSRSNLVESGVEKFAGIYEIPYVNKYELEKAEPEVARVIGSSHYEIASIKQSATFERYLTPKLEVSTFF